MATIREQDGGAIVRHETGAKHGEGTGATRWTFANEGEAAKQFEEFPAAELTAAPKALRDKLTDAAALRADMKG